jgi:hypothetical protein
MINPLYYLPGPPKLWLGLFVLVVVVPVVAWLGVSYHQHRSPYLNVMLGCTAVAGVKESGLHFQEYNGSEPFRWTNGNAKLLVPISVKRPPQRLWVSIETLRPKPTKVRCQVLVDDVPVFDGSAPLGKWEKDFDLSSHPFSKQVLIELRSETFIPKRLMDGGKNTDTRVLGVQVKGIMLQRDAN